MKLTPHQKEIVNAINAEKVYDIPTYLNHFKKCTPQQYNIEDIKNAFSEYEEGKKYSFSQSEDGSFVTNVYDIDGNFLDSFPTSHGVLNAYFINYPLYEPVHAQINEDLENVNIEFKGYNYSFNFLKYSYNVADNFDDIKDFIALWYYLKNEALIFEVEKPIKANEISLFFELSEHKIVPALRPSWELKTKIIDETNLLIEQNNIPYKPLENYIPSLWKPNEEHILMCQDFIGKKIVPTSGLQVYADHKYKTFEERSQKRNLFVAWIAVLISVASVVWGNIPFFQNTVEREMLQTINANTTLIEKEISNTNDALEQLQDELHGINIRIQESNNSSKQPNKSN